MAGAHGRPHPTLQVHPLLGDAFAALDVADLPWALLRGADDLAAPRGDVDLLVSAAHVTQLDDVLEEVGFRQALAPGHLPHRFFFAYDSDTDIWLKLDLVDSIAFGPFQELHTEWAHAALRTRERRDGLWRLPREDEAWLHVLHLLLDKGPVPRHAPAGARARVLDDPTAGEVARHVLAAVGAATFARVPAALRVADDETLTDAADALRRDWARQRAGEVLQRRWTQRVRRRLGVSGVGTVGRGLAVALLGPDGAGKTTLAAGVAGTMPVPTQYVYSGLWQASPRDALLRRVPGGRLGLKVGRLARASVQARLHRRRGRLVILDRTVQEALHGASDRSLGGRIIRHAVRALGAFPDLAVLLDAPAETLFARKQEHSVDRLNAMRPEHLALARSFPASVVVDAACDADTVRRRTVAHVWDRWPGGRSGAPSSPRGPSSVRAAAAPLETTEQDPGP